MCYIPDFLDHWSEYNRQQEEALAKRPKCDCCGEPIQTEFCFKVGNKIYCEDCMEENKVSVDALMN